MSKQKEQINTARKGNIIKTFSIKKTSFAFLSKGIDGEIKGRCIDKLVEFYNSNKNKPTNTHL